MPYAPHPDESGYNWASRGVDTHQVFGFMPGNIPANAAMIRDIRAIAQPVPDEPVRGEGRRIAGVHAQLWSETLRNDAGGEYMPFPRRPAPAQRGRSSGPSTPPPRPRA